MRILKKFMLAAGLVGLMGTAGFVKEAKAATATIDNLEVTVEDNEVTVEWESDDTDSVTVEIKVAGKTVVSDSVSADAEEYAVEDLLDLINENGIDLGNSISNVAVSAKVGSKSATAEEKAFPDDTLYKLAVSGTGVWGSFEVENFDGDSKTYESTHVYAKKETEATISPETADGYVFEKWTLNGQTVDDPYEIDSVEKAITLVATAASMSSQVDFTVNGNKSSANVNLGNSVKFTWTLKSGALLSNIAYIVVDGTYKEIGESYAKPSGNTVNTSQVFDTEGTHIVYMTGKNASGYDWVSNSVTVTVGPKQKPSISISGENYITNGYKLKLTAKRSGTDKYIKWEMKTSSDADLSISNDTLTVEVEPKVSVDAGKSKTITLVGTFRDPDTTEEAAVSVEYQITVYPKPSLSQGSDRTLTCTVPSKVNTGTESGGDSDDNKTAFSVSKVRIYGLREDGSTFYSGNKEVNDNKVTISLDTIMEEANRNLAFNKSQRVTFKIYPANSDANYNKKVSSSAEGNIYKITVNGTGIRETSYYGLKGQSLEIKAVTSAGTTFSGYWKDDEKNTSETRKVTVDGEKTYTAVLGARSDAADADGSGLDRVPRTGQSNVFVYVLVVIVIGAAGFGLYTYNKKSKNNI